MRSRRPERSAGPWIRQVLSTQPDPRRTRGCVLLLTWLAFAIAMYAGRPLYSSVATLVGTVTAVVLAVVGWSEVALPRRAAGTALCCIGVAMPLVGGYGSILPQDREFLVIMLTSATSLVAGALLTVAHEVTDRMALWLSAVAFSALSGFIILTTRPTIDVWNFTNQAAHAVFSRNIYGMQWEGASPDAESFVVTEGFPYLPMTAVLVAPFRWLLGDVRWGMLACLLLVGALLSRRSNAPDGRSPLGPLLWFTPGALIMIETAWTESLVLALLIPAMLAFSRGRTGLGVVLLVLTLATKQHTAVILPVLAAWPAVGLRRASLAALAAAGLCLPWLLADPRTFYEDTVRFHLEVDPRLDADTLFSMAVHYGWSPPFWIAGLIVLITIAAVAWGVRRSQADLPGVAMALALTLLVANLVNKQAFLNQYWLVAGLMLFAMACNATDRATPPAESERDEERSVETVEFPSSR